MGDGVELAERRGVAEHHRAELFPVELPIRAVHAAEAALQRLAELRARLGELVIHLVAVEAERAHAAQDLQRRGLARAGAAGEADYAHVLAQGRGDVPLGQGALAEYAVGSAREVDYRALTAYAALAAVDDGLYLAVEVAEHLLRRLGARLARGVGRRRGQGQAALAQQLQRQRVIRASEAHAAPAREHDARYLRPGGQDYGERSRPEARRERPRRLRHLRAALFKGLRPRHHQRQGLYLRAALDLVDALHGALVEAAAREAVHRLGRHGDKRALPYELGGLGDVFGYYSGFHSSSACCFRRSARSAAMSASMSSSSAPSIIWSIL